MKVAIPPPFAVLSCLKKLYPGKEKELDETKLFILVSQMVVMSLF